MIIIYKELIKKNITKLTKEDIRKYALTKNQILTEKETTILYNYINNYYEELLNKNTTSFSYLKQNLRKDLFDTIIQLYNEYSKLI